MDDKVRGEGWRRAFGGLVGQDFASMDRKEAMRLRGERLQHGLLVKGVTDVDKVADMAKRAVLDIVQTNSAFSPSVFNVLPWRNALLEYQKVANDVTERPLEGRMERINLLLRRKRELGNLLRAAASVVISRQGLEEALKQQEIWCVSEQMTRFLVSELNDELEWPRIVGIVSITGPEDRPFYAALPEQGGYPEEFLTVCRIFDH
jgi:hypothetical protein